MKKIIFLLMLSIFIFNAFTTDYLGIQYSIRFFDKKIYFLGDQIMIKATIKNDSAGTCRFKVATNRVYNLDFDTRTSTNLSSSHSQNFIMGRATNQPVFYREVSLEPGEEYAIIIDLSEYIDFQDAGLFIIQGKFYPELFVGEKSQYLISNKLTLNLRPPVDSPEMRRVVEAETGIVLQKEALAPDQVVTYTIRARQQSQWERFFLYLDLEALLLHNGDRARRYTRLSQEGKQEMLEEYRQGLIQQRIPEDKDIIAVPNSFVILDTYYTPDEAQVRVLAKFEYDNFTKRVEYIYYLKRVDRYWLIYNYTAENKGTE